MSPVEIIDGEEWIIPGPRYGVLPLEILEPTQTTCATPGCRQNGSQGLWGLFCAECADNLARIRDELDAEKEVRKAKYASIGNGLRTVSRGPSCTSAGCDEPRRQGEMLCAVCAAMDVEVDEAA